MLTENDVVNTLTQYLISAGYQIRQNLSTKEKGVDVIAENGLEVLYVEAKGETSSLQNSKRYGRPFNKNQIKTHISVAILASLQIISKLPSRAKTRVVIALPDTPEQRLVINQISSTLKRLELRIYWVSNNVVIVE